MSESPGSALLSQTLDRLGDSPRFIVQSRVTRVVGQIVEASPLEVSVGEVCRVVAGGVSLLALVVGFNQRGVSLMPMGEVEGIQPGAAVRPLGRSLYVSVGPGLIGRILDGLGHPLDGGTPVPHAVRRPLNAAPPNPLERARISAPLGTGVRAIDGLLTLGQGQRIGIMAGSGVGKSVLLGMIARRTTADVNVIALLGERGREVREFIESDLGPEGLERSVLVVATSDQPAVVRATGALVATGIAEYFRDQGRQVLLMVDSITRVAMAWREIGLAAGEPPTTKGYPPSVFAHLPRLLERAGPGIVGGITALYTVLVEGDDFSEPVADATRSILDGHIVLARRLAAAKHFPAIDILESVSRVRDAVIPATSREAANAILQLEAAYRAHEDLIAVGAYKPGANPRVDAALKMREELLTFLQQHPDEWASFADTQSRLQSLATPLKRTPS